VLFGMSAEDQDVWSISILVKCFPQ